MLLMIRAEAAIVRTSPFDGCVIDLRHLRRFDEDLAAAAIVIVIVGDEDLLGPVIRAALHHEHAVVLKDDFCFYFAKALRADGKGDVVIEIWTNPARSHVNFQRPPAASRTI
jgi:hypothetical protein